MGNIDLRFYRSIFLRRFPVFALVAVVVTLLGLAVAFMLPRVYRAEARIMVETSQIPTDLVRSTVPAEIVKQLQLIELQMMARANLLALAERFGLYSDRPGTSENDIVDDMRSRMSIEQIRLDTPRGNEGATAFIVSFKAREPVLAAEVVNEFVKLMVQKSISQRTGQANTTLQFFQQETEALGNKLGQLESEILVFKNKNRDALPESLSFRRTQQISQQERLMQLGREAASLRDGRSRLVQMFAGTGREASAAMTPAERTLDQLRRVMSEQRTVFAETSPVIVALQSQIGTLEKAVRSERSGEPDRGGGKAAPSELDFQLAEINRRLTFIAEEKTAIEKSLSELTASIAATPGVESALNALERQYQNAQAQYNMATARLAEASTGHRIEQRAKGERLSVLELATPPQRPSGPRRLFVAAGGAFAGVGLGLGLIILLEILNRSIRRPAELIATLGIEPLAVIPYIPVGGETRPKRLAGVVPALQRVVGK